MDAFFIPLRLIYKKQSYKRPYVTLLWFLGTNYPSCSVLHMKVLFLLQYTHIKYRPIYIILNSTHYIIIIFVMYSNIQPNFNPVIQAPVCYIPIYGTVHHHHKI